MIGTKIYRVGFMSGAAQAACVLLVLAAGACAAQSTSSDEGTTLPTRITVYGAGDGVVAPSLVSSNPLDIPGVTCKKKDKVVSEIRLSFFVSPNGEPRRITFLNPLGNELDLLALRLLSESKFAPGTLDGKPVAVWQTDTVRTESCHKRTKDGKDGTIDSLQLISQPVQTVGPLQPAQELSRVTFDPGLEPNSVPQPVKIDRVGRRVQAPVPLFTPVAIYSDEARRRKISGVCLISLIVDEHGLPQRPRITRSLGYGLDEQALETISRYRFRPAIRDDADPVPVMITIEVNFRLY